MLNSCHTSNINNIRNKKGIIMPFNNTCIAIQIGINTFLDYTWQYLPPEILDALAYV